MRIEINQTIFNKFLKKTYSDNFSYLDSLALQERINRFEQRYLTLENLVTEKAFLWVAKKEGCAPIYIFNTSHYLYGVDAKDIFDDAIDNCLDKVDVVFTEIPTNLESDVLSYSEDKPIYLLDNMIAKKASEMSKELKALENTNIRKLLGVDVQEADAQYSIINRELENESSDRLAFLQQDTTNYLAHVSPSTLSTAVESKGGIKRRNQFWMSSILEESLQQKTSLVTCGAIHSHGIYGLPNLLANEGYTLTPLMKTAPTPKSVMLKQITAGSSLHFLFKHQPSPIMKVDDNQNQTYFKKTT